MKKIKSVLAAILLALIPVTTLACSPAPMPTDSLEPVTIKIADMYFQIPEGYLDFPFLRVPMEREYIRFNVPLEKLNSSSEQNRKEGYYIVQIVSGKYEGRGRERISLSDNVRLVISGAPYPGFSNDPSAETILEYVNSISTKAKPATWKNDSELASKFGLGGDPCSGMMARFAGQKIKDAFFLSYNDIKAGLSHRNETIRGAAAVKAAGAEDEHQQEVLDSLKRLAKEDHSANVRAAATSGLAEIAQNKPEILPFIVNIMLTDKNDWVRRNASHRLNKFSAETIMPHMPTINSLSEENYIDVGNVLVWIVNHEVSENKLTSPDQLSNNSHTALKKLVSILKKASDGTVIQYLLNPLRNSKSAVATAELIETLNKIVVNGDGKASAAAATLLSEMGAGAADSVPLIIEKLKTSNDLEELAGLLRSFQKFGDEGEAAVPIIIKYTKYNLENENPNIVRHELGVRPWQVRLAAVTALHFMEIKTSEAKAALEAAQNDHNSMVKNQAKAALKEF